jgi:plasmid stabilization system protein ParE
MRRVRWAFRARRDFIQITDYYVARATHYPDELLDRSMSLRFG